MNPRIQVEHTVTEVITGHRLVRAQILIAQGHALHGAEVGMPQQDDDSAQRLRHPVPHHDRRSGEQVHRRTTARSSRTARRRFRHSARRRHGLRRRGHHAVLRFAAREDDRQRPHLRDGAATAWTARLREFRIRGVKTNIPFLENVIQHPTFRSGQATTTLIDTTPELFQFKPRRDRATKLLNFLGDVIVNGNPHAKGYKPEKRCSSRAAPPLSTASSRRRRARANCCWSSARRNSPNGRCKQKAAARHRHDLPRRAPIADGHARAHLRHAGDRRRRGAPHAEAVSAGNVGRRDVRHGDALPARGSVGAPAPAARARFRTSVSRCCSAARTRSATRIIRTTSSRAS